VFGELEQAADNGRRLAVGRITINEGPLYGGIRDSGLNGSTDKIGEMAYIMRVRPAT